MTEAASPAFGTSATWFSLSKALSFRRAPAEPAVKPIEALFNDAECLLEYACQSGVELDEKLVHAIVAASKRRTELNDDETTAALIAITTLANRLKPVTAESVKASKNRASGRQYSWAALLGLTLLAISVLSYITGSASDALNSDIARANQLAVRLNSRVQLQSPAAGNTGAAAAQYDQNVLTDLQQYAGTIREIEGVAHQLSFYVFASQNDPVAKKGFDPNSLEISVPVVVGSAVPALTVTYQQVRSFAQDVQRRTAVYYGAITKFVLPPLYAILGTYAYLLRLFSEQVRLRTFVPSISDKARFIIAGIGGIAVGLFSNSFNLEATASLSPLAIAFLVGYGTDIFYSVLDRLEDAFMKPRSTAQEPAVTKSAAQ